MASGSARPGRGVWLTGAAFVVLSALVGLGLMNPLDRALKQVFRPDMVWSPWQVWAERIEDALNPTHVVVVVGLVALAVAARRRSPWPLMVCVGAAAMTGMLALVVKLLLRRPDPNYAVTGAGSYPSGHTVSFVVGVGLVLLVTVGLTRWTWVLVVAAGVLMGVCLVVEGAHWFTDVVGGAVLGAFVLSVAALAPARRPGGFPYIPW